MSRHSLIPAVLLVALGWSVVHAAEGKEDSPVGYVHPLIGTAPSTTRSAVAHGAGTENSAQVVPAVTMPFGMTHWTPQTRHVETKCVAPYYYLDTLITGFRGSHWLSGSCTQDYGSLTIMPLIGPLETAPLQRGSRYSHGREVSTPSYYRVVLDDSGIDCELTATERCGFLRFSFPSVDTGYILIEPNSDEGQGFIRIDPAKNEISGHNPVHRIYQGWGEPAGFSGYFVARFSEPFVTFGVYEGSKVTPGASELGGRPGAGAYVGIGARATRQVVVRVGTSFTSIAQARKNLEREAAGISFDAARRRLNDRWGGLLSRVGVAGGNESDKVKFYTALYHAFLLPRTFSDCDGSYPSFAGGDSVCSSGSDVYYCDFSLWDTYRALHPLFNLLIPEVNASMMRSLLTKARQGGWLPIFPCWNSYTSAMIGDHAIAVIADAVVKSRMTLTEADYGYLRKNATEVPADRATYVRGKGVRALDSYIRYGYIPLEDSVKESFHKGEQVSRTLEYAYDDFALSQIARSMGKDADAEYFLRRSRNYRNVFDPARRCVAGRHADGTFTAEFDKTRRMPYITEGTPWQYTWYVPHDISGLMELMGGQKAFEDELDAFFAAGQYWHGNEPDQQVPFLYTYTDSPWKSQDAVRRILNDEYSDTPGGLCGNDDSGQISAWFVFASMGLYPVCPGTPDYAITSPLFERITLRLPKGRILVIRADGTSEGREHIRSMTFNGKTLDRFHIRHDDLVKGGTLRFFMQTSVPGLSGGQRP
jgi:predicted alpha-1,2-mannosidase